LNTLTMHMVTWPQHGYRCSICNASHTQRYSQHRYRRSIWTRVTALDNYPTRAGSFNRKQRTRRAWHGSCRPRSGREAWPSQSISVTGKCVGLSKLLCACRSSTARKRYREATTVPQRALPTPRRLPGRLVHEDSETAGDRGTRGSAGSSRKQKERALQGHAEHADASQAQDTQPRGGHSRRRGADETTLFRNRAVRYGEGEGEVFKVFKVFKVWGAPL
jgi:hypothetical protein